MRCCEVAAVCASLLIASDDAAAPTIDPKPIRRLWRTLRSALLPRIGWDQFAMTTFDRQFEGITLRQPAARSAATGVSSFSVEVDVPHPLDVDDIDRTLIDLLLRDVKTTNRELAARTGISVSAVSVRLRELTASGAINFTAIIDWENAGFDWLIIARIRTQTRSPREVAKDVGNLEQCLVSSVSLGAHDVVAYFLVQDRAELKRLTDDELPRIAGIADMSVDLATDTTITPNGRRVFIGRGRPILRLPAPRIQLDDLDVAILQALIEDGRQSSRRIARAQRASEGTVRTRLNRLVQANLVRAVAMVDPVVLGMAGVIATISIQVDRSQVIAIRNRLAAIPELAFMAVCVGSCDLSITLTANDPQELVGLISDRVQAIDGVHAVEILLLIDVVLFSPYMKRLAATGP